MPSWLSEEDVGYFVSKFDKEGFTGGLNYYRALNLYVSFTSFSKLEQVSMNMVTIGVGAKFYIGDYISTMGWIYIQEIISHGCCLCVKGFILFFEKAIFWPNYSYGSLEESD